MEKLHTTGNSVTCSANRAETASITASTVATNSVTRSDSFVAADDENHLFDDGKVFDAFFINTRSFFDASGGETTRGKKKNMWERWRSQCVHLPSTRCVTNCLENFAAPRDSPPFRRKRFSHTSTSCCTARTAGRVTLSMTLD